MAVYHLFQTVELAMVPPRHSTVRIHIDSLLIHLEALTRRSAVEVRRMVDTREMGDVNDLVYLGVIAYLVDRNGHWRRGVMENDDGDTGLDLYSCSCSFRAVDHRLHVAYDQHDLSVHLLDILYLACPHLEYHHRICRLFHCVYPLNLLRHHPLSTSAFPPACVEVLLLVTGAAVQGTSSPEHWAPVPT